jgi:LysM repeat protein
MKTLLPLLLLLTCVQIQAQDALSPVEYIATYKEIAIAEMKRTGVPAAITLAQGLLETENGNSPLVKKSNNHFGIKCKSNWTAASVTHDDDEKGECFRAYKTAEESYKDHSDFLRNNQRYGFLFLYEVTDYKAWALGLKKAGYATNPRYPQILISHIEKYNLQQYTLFTDESDNKKVRVAKYRNKQQEDNAANATVTTIDDITVQNGEQNTISSTTVDAITNTSTASTSVEVELVPIPDDKIITINGSKCVFAPSGTSLLALATKHNISLSKLLSFNEMAEDGILPANDYIYLEKKAKIGQRDFHVLKFRQSLYDVAQINGVQYQTLLDYNRLWGNEDVYVGTKIYLKPNLAPVKKFISDNEVVAENTANKVTHTVQAKEGLYSISKKYNVTMLQLREWNRLQTDALSIGQQLIVLQ